MLHYFLRSCLAGKLSQRSRQLRASWALAACTALAFLTTPPFGYAEEAQPGNAERLATARTAIKDMSEALKTALVTQIKSGGAASAIPVCQTIAPAMAADASAKHKLSVRRTALKLRNQSNKPDAFEARVLAEFVEKLATGADPATLEHSETVTDGGKSLFRYMKAIPTAAEPCLACHGTDLKDDVKAELAKLYPGDQATGFKAGDLRGAFSVVIEGK